MFIKPLSKEIIKNLWNRTSPIEGFIPQYHSTSFKVGDRSIYVKHSEEGFAAYCNHVDVSGAMNVLEKVVILLLIHRNRLLQWRSEKSSQKQKLNKILNMEDK